MEVLFAHYPKAFCQSLHFAEVVCEKYCQIQDLWKFWIEILEFFSSVFPCMCLVFLHQVLHLWRYVSFCSEMFMTLLQDEIKQIYGCLTINGLINNFIACMLLMSIFNKTFSCKGKKRLAIKQSNKWKACLKVSFPFKMKND